MQIKLQDIEIELARRDFWDFLKTVDPSFFKESRPHLKKLAITLQAFFEGTLINENTGKPYTMLGLSLPPRTGKSYSLTKFCAWVLGQSILNQIATVSYNETLASDFSRFVRDEIMQEKSDPNDLVFNDIFPSTMVKKGDASFKKWSLEGHFFNYIGTGMNGSLTGKGFSLGIIDDPIKNAEEAFNDRVLESHYTFYKNTFRSRIENGGKIIINHTRWATNDLLGRIKRDLGDRIYCLEMQMEDSDGELLCEELCDKENWIELKDTIDPNILSANYQQVPIDIEGRLYKEFQTYSIEELNGELPNDSYTDTADKGADYLCSITYKYDKKSGFVYVTDIVYTKEGMEITEPLVAKQLSDKNVAKALVESNNGGRGFARAVEKLCKEKHSNNFTSVEWFHQSANKEARILTQSHWVCKNILMPDGWGKRWPKFFEAVMTYSKEGKNEHDDAPDVLTGIAEQFTKPKTKFGVW